MSQKERIKTETGENGTGHCEIGDKDGEENLYTVDPADVYDDAGAAQLPTAALINNISMGSDSRDNPENEKAENPLLLATKCEPLIYVDEETRMICNLSPSEINSPRDIVSPADPGEVSSPFSAMESDGMETGFDDASLSAPGDAARRPMGFFGASTPLEYTTTPGASSSACDDNYESSGSRKKRRKTRRDMQPSYNTARVNHLPLRFPASTGWCHDPDSPFSPPQGFQKGPNFNFAEYGSRRSSAGTGNVEAQPDDDSPSEFIPDQAKRSRTSTDVANEEEPVKLMTDNSSTLENVPVSISTTPCTTNAVRRPHCTHRRPVAAATAETDSILHKQFPRKAEPYELRIISQPETQHRARYLTEGSRGPVKDASQQNYPKVQLLGYKTPTTLQVFVATDSGKIKPHGFYQACRVTGRNTSQCEEHDIEGTKVIEIPFKSDDMILSIDCVGILKLRNTDVEARMGVRNQKRNQSVRLVFRVCLDKVPNHDPANPLILQVASVRISCTQPLGQPEITKKSIDRCSVAGGTEMFIIGKNFHRGTRVIYQDPEDPNNSQWSQEGEVDKDTFHQTHMVVRVPPYHDQMIAKPVNVQLLVEYQGKKCEPHSFTYLPLKKEAVVLKEEVSPSTNVQTQEKSASAMQSLLDGPIDKKFLVALFSKLFSSVGTENKGDSQGNDHAEQNGVSPQDPTAAAFGMREKLLMEAALSGQNVLMQAKPDTQPQNIFQVPEIQPNTFHFVEGSDVPNERTGVGNLRAASFAYVSGSQNQNVAGSCDATVKLSEAAVSAIVTNGANVYNATSTTPKVVPFIPTGVNSTVPMVQLNTQQMQNTAKNNSVNLTFPAVKIEHENAKQPQFLWTENLNKGTCIPSGSQPVFSAQQTQPLLVQDSQPVQVPNTAGSNSTLGQIAATVNEPLTFQGNLSQGKVFVYQPVNNVQVASGVGIQQMSVPTNALQKPAASNLENVTGSGNVQGQADNQSIFGAQLFAKDVSGSSFVSVPQTYQNTDQLLTTLTTQSVVFPPQPHGSQYQQASGSPQVFASAANVGTQPFLAVGTSAPNKLLQSFSTANTSVVTTIAGTQMTPTFQLSSGENAFQSVGVETPINSRLAFEITYEPKKAEQYVEPQSITTSQTNVDTSVCVQNPNQAKQGMDLQAPFQAGTVMPLPQQQQQQQQQSQVMPGQMVSHMEIMDQGHGGAAQLHRPVETPMQVDSFHASQPSVEVSNIPQTQVAANTLNLSPLGQAALPGEGWKEPGDQLRSNPLQTNRQVEGMGGSGMNQEQAAVAAQVYHSPGQSPGNLSMVQGGNAGNEMQQGQSSQVNAQAYQRHPNDATVHQAQVTPMATQVYQTPVSNQNVGMTQTPVATMPGQLYQSPGSTQVSQQHQVTPMNTQVYHSPGSGQAVVMSQSRDPPMYQSPPGGMQQPQTTPPYQPQAGDRACDVQQPQNAAMHTQVYQPPCNQAGVMSQGQDLPIYRSPGNEQLTGMQPTQNSTISPQTFQTSGEMSVTPKQNHDAPMATQDYRPAGNEPSGDLQSGQSAPMSTQEYQESGHKVAAPRDHGTPMSTQVYRSPAGGDQPTQQGAGTNAGMMTIPVTGEFMFQIGETTPLSTVNNGMNQTVLQHQAGTQEAHSRVLEHTADMFAMDQLLQSIDGSENLAAISGEEVQRHFQ